MENDKECNLLLDNIINELETAKKQGIEISEKLNEQTNTLSDTSVKLEKIENETVASTWYINYMKATFGKIYKKCNHFPDRFKSKSIGRKIRLETDILLAKHKNKEIKSQTTVKQEYVNNDKMSKISNIISDINYISNMNSNEIDKQNKILDYNSEMTDDVEEKMYTNRLRIKKILD